MRKRVKTGERRRAEWPESAQIAKNEPPSHYNATTATLLLFRWLLRSHHWRVPVGIGRQTHWRGVLHLWHSTVAGARVGSWRFGALDHPRWLLHLFFWLLLGCWFLCLGRDRRRIVWMNRERGKVSVIGSRTTALLFPLFLLHLPSECGKHLLVWWQAGIRLVHRRQPWGIALWPIDCRWRSGLSTAGDRTLQSVAGDGARPSIGGLSVRRRS